MVRPWWSLVLAEGKQLHMHTAQLDLLLNGTGLGRHMLYSLDREVLT